MTKERRSDLIFGIILLAVGVWFLASQFKLVPGLNEIIDIQYQWPLIVISVGGLLFLLALLTRTPGLAVPACIVGGIGGILYWTTLREQWSDWTYLWTLIPGFVGLGVILSTLLGGEDSRGYREGLKLILVSAILFIVFVMIFSGRPDLYRYWPILVILAGVWIVIQTIFRRK